jgi:hypothetical protein
VRNSTKIDFVYGINLRLSLRQYGSTNDNPYVEERLSTTYQRYFGAGIGFTFGLFYCLSERFSLGSEINPYVQYSFLIYSPSDYGNTKVRRIEYEIFSNISILSLRYSW